MKERAWWGPGRVRAILVLVPKAPLSGEHKANGGPTSHYSPVVPVARPFVLCSVV